MASWGAGGWAALGILGGFGRLWGSDLLAARLLAVQKTRYCVVIRNRYDSPCHYLINYVHNLVHAAYMHSYLHEVNALPRFLCSWLVEKLNARLLWIEDVNAP